MRDERVTAGVANAKETNPPRKGRNMDKRNIFSKLIKEFSALAVNRWGRLTLGHTQVASKPVPIASRRDNGHKPHRGFI